MDFPVDILLDIVVHLPLHDVLALRRASKSLYTATHLRALWALLFRTHVLDKLIPYPDTPLADLSARDLESLTYRALALRRTWTSPQPVPRRRLTFNTPTEPTAHIIFLQFLPGRSNRWLISVCRIAAHPSTYLLQCWDVALEHPTCVAKLTHADGPYGGVVLNSDPASPAILAMQSAQTETFSIRFDATDPECGFETLATIEGIRELHLLSGSTLVTRRLEDDGALSLWDLADLGQEKLRLLNPSFIQPNDRVQAVHIAHDYALVVRIQSIEIYSTIPRPSLLALHGTPIAYPLAQSKLQWRTDTVVLCAQHTSTSWPPPIHLLVRFGTIYPWPANVLHHYQLVPNPTYHRRGRAPTPPSSSHAPAPLSHAVTTEYNLPYDPRPRSTHTVIGSPVRLFGQSAMALGRYGTALWLDNHAEYLMGPSERGQRLAGRLLTEGGESGGEVANASGEAADASGVSMVFGVRDDDTWTRVAMEEQAGRIALGHDDGTITLLEY